MRILQLIARSQMRGAEVFAGQLSDRLAERGHQVVLAYLLGCQRALPTRPDVRQAALGGDRYDRLPVSPTVWRNLRRLLKAFGPDIVQANGSETLKYAALLRLVDSSQPIIYRNISVMSMWAGAGVKRRLVKKALRHMTHVASVTKVGGKDLIEGFGLPEDRVSVLPIGVAVPPEISPQQREVDRAAVRQELGLPGDCPLVVHVGSFAPEKNHRELIDAFRRVVARVPTARLLLVGDGPIREQTTAEIGRWDLIANVTFAGVVPDAPRLISAADVMALPSLREGLPGVVLEAGVARVPTAAYDVGGVTEVIEDGVNGIVVPQGDVAGLASALVLLLSDATLRERLGSEARRTMSEKYELEQVVSLFEALYARVAGHPQAPDHVRTR